jgi:RecA-family ATPase
MSEFDFDAELKKVKEYEEYAAEQPENLYPIEDWDMQITMPTWTLDRMIPAKSIGMLFGPSNSGKSHLICDVITSMMIGEDQWQGHAMQSGDVVLFSESQGHILARLKAYLGYKGKPKTNALYALPTKALEVHQVESLGKWMQKLPNPPMMIVFDTLATMFSFEENDNKEASKLIKRIEDHIVPNLDPSGCVVIVHHTSKASEGRSARGASALIGNIDWSINVQWEKDIEKTVARWDKDRWRIIDHSPQWAGQGHRVPVNFTNGQAEVMILDWEEFSEDAVEVAKELRKEVEMDAMKAKVAEAVRLARKPIFIHTNTRARIPAGCVPFRLSDVVDNTRNVPAMIEYIKDSFAWEPVYTPKGIEVGINVVGGQNP